jgi:hypothetical protein
LQDQAGSLAQAVSVFKLDGGSGRISHALAAPAPSRRSERPSLPAPERAMRKLSPNANSGPEDEWEEF